MKRGGVIAVTTAILLAGAPSAAAFDTGPHGDLTVDAMRAEGFNAAGADAARVNNWFVDMYVNAEKNPFSGHSSWIKVLLGGAIGNSEDWPQAVVDAVTRMHFDSTVKGAETTAGLKAEWLRLRDATNRTVQGARQRRNPLELLTAIGASLHQLQDFYSHTNWAEPLGTGVFEAPGWKDRGQGTSPTWFDVPDDVREKVRIYAGGAPGIARKHGGFRGAPDRTMAKDAPGRPHYENAYISAYFASRQWIRAIRTWLADEALWQSAQRWATRLNELRYDLHGADGMSVYTGHLYGQGEPFAPGNAEDRGWGGSLVALRAVTKSYFEDRGRTLYRRTFERVIPSLGATGADPLPDSQVPIASSRPIQEATRFVRLQVLSMRGIDLGDIGPDDADMYARAVIAGQRYVSAIIQAHDRFSFPDPYEPFTFIKAVPVGGRYDEPVREITVEVHTSSARYAGTDDDVFLRIGPNTRFELEKRAYDDFERGDRDTYSVPIDAAAREGLTLGAIRFLEIEKARDGVAGGWKLGGVVIRINGRVVSSDTRIERWLEDDRRTYRAPFSAGASLGPALGVWFDLHEDDLRIYGRDDQGDVNRFDARDAIVRAYAPGDPPDEAQVTGGRELGGRLTKGGDKASLRYRISTLDFTPAPPPRPTEVQPSTG